LSGSTRTAEPVERRLPQLLVDGEIACDNQNMMVGCANMSFQFTGNRETEGGMRFEMSGAQPETWAEFVFSPE
jgi:hypothetical protein